MDGRGERTQRLGPQPSLMSSVSSPKPAGCIPPSWAGQPSASRGEALTCTDMLLCRTDRFLDADIKRKIALFCDVTEEAVITAKDVSTIYEVPLVLKAEGLDQIILKQLGLPMTRRKTEAWEELVDRIKNPTDEITIHVVGKYTGYEDSYKSLNEAAYHGGFAHRASVKLHWVEAEALEKEGGAKLLEGANAHPGARRVRLARHARHDEGRRVRAREADPVLRHLLRLPVGHRRVRAQRLRPRRRRLHRGRRERAAQGDLQAARPARRGRPRRHHAPGPLRLRARAGLGGRAHLRHLAHPRAAPPPLRVQLPLRAGAGRRAACACRAARPTASSWRSPSCRRIPGSSPCSSTPSSSRARCGRIRCLPASSARRSQHKTGTLAPVSVSAAGR